MDEHQLYGATLDRVYRLALLAAGSPRAAARLTRRAYARRDPAAADPEAALARGLLAARPWRWPWRPDPAAAAYAGLATADLQAMRAAFAAAAPAARLALGAPHLVGFAIGPLAEQQPAAPDAPWPRRAGDHHALLALLARAWGLLPAGAPYADVHEQVLLLAGALPQAQADELRALLLAHSPAAERSRAIREGLRRAAARLAAALPGLFGGEAPAELRAGLARAAAPRRRAPMPRHARLRLGLVAIVAAIAVAVIALPRGAPQGAPPRVAAEQAAAEGASEALVQAALRRLDSPDGQGVRHERFAAVTGDYGWTLERWQELAHPHRFRVEVRDDQDRLRFALASDGRELVQQRLSLRAAGSPVEGSDFAISTESLASLMPMLRQQPDSLLLLGSLNPGFNLERYYLNLAVDAPLRDLGGTLAAGRPAQLLAFESATPIPPDPDDAFAASDAPPAQVLLAIDLETKALLEARVLPPAGQEMGEVATPWRAELLELLPSAPAETFALPPLAQGVPRVLVSARMLGEGSGLVQDLGLAANAVAQPLYFPSADAPVSYALDMGDRRTMLVRETAEDILQLIPFTDGTVDFAEGARSQRQAGERTYEVIYPERMPPGRGTSLATIFFDPERQSGMHVIYSHAYAAQPEREARLDALIRSLAPLAVGG